VKKKRSERCIGKGTLLHDKRSYDDG